MCLITFAYNAHPKYKLIVAANRDEFYERPTRRAKSWKDELLPEIIAGKDLEAGGTWMGISKKGDWGALTNYRDPSNINKAATSRGELVLNYLKGKLTPEEYLKLISPKSDQYNGFNILLGDKESLYHFSNHTLQVTKIKPGIHGVSNAVLNTPWPKLDQAKRDLEAVIKNPDFEKDSLFTLLKKDNKPSEHLLPKTGIPLEWEKAISSVFIKTESYGTRCSTVLLIDKEDNMEFTERRFNTKTSSIIEENTFRTGF